MPTYTVHAPPARAGDSGPDPERFVFLRDGFHFWAFVLAPFWLLLHRLWLVFVGYCIVTVLIAGFFYWTGAPDRLEFLANVAVALLIGFEAATLRRWTLTRRGWTMLGFVVADNAERAERRFYAEWTRNAPATPKTESTQPYASPVRRGPPSGNDVIGLFPEPRS